MGQVRRDQFRYTKERGLEFGGVVIAGLEGDALASGKQERMRVDIGGIHSDREKGIEGALNLSTVWGAMSAAIVRSPLPSALHDKEVWLLSIRKQRILLAEKGSHIENVGFDARCAFPGQGMCSR